MALIRLLFALILFTSSSSFAQDVTHADLEKQITEEIRNSTYKNFVTFSVENDSIGGGTDSNYTSGIRLTYFDVNAEIPSAIDMIADHIPTFDINRTTSLAWSIGQNLYTPQNTKSRTQDPHDRPWAGWLYASAGLATLTGNHIDELELTLGMVGPAAQGERSQKFIHDIIGSADPNGWDNELKNEPGIIVSWLRRWPEMAILDALGLAGTVEPNINISLGNIYTYAGTGLSLRLGPSEERWQDTPPRVRPAIPGTGFFEVPDDDWSWYLFAGADGRAIARNIFLDGNTFEDSHSVDKKYFVMDLNAGLAITFKNMRLSYSLNYRTDEFDGQQEDSVFGIIGLSYAF